MNRKVLPPKHQVFINFRGDELRNNFISHLVDALQRNEINIFTDKKEQKGENISNLFNRIEESKIALAVLSKRYTESVWCLDELVKITELADQGKLKVLPIFYNVTTLEVKIPEGEFGINFRRLEWEYRSEQPKIHKWKEALASITGKIGLTFDDKSLSESEFIGNIVKDVLKMLQAISSVQITNSPINQLPKREETFPRATTTLRSCLKAPKGNLVNPIKPEITGFTERSFLAPQAIYPGYGLTPEQGIHVTQFSNVDFLADKFRSGLPLGQASYNTVLKPSHAPGLTATRPAYDNVFPPRQSNNESAERGESSSFFFWSKGETSPVTNNSKKPLEKKPRV